MSEEKNEASDQQKFKKRKRIQALEVQEFYGINSVQRESGKSTSVAASVDERNRNPSLEIVPSFAPGEFIRVWGGFLTFPG